MSKFFTADFHIGHKNIIDYCDRPFRTADGQMDTDAMRRTFIDNFRSVLKPGDELYILGDLSFDLDEAVSFLQRVPGQKFMVWGNHDPRGKDRKVLETMFVKTGDILETKLATGEQVVMCHYPMLRWNKAHFGSFMIHGHVHGRIDYPYPMRILDVGVDSEFPAAAGRMHQKYFPVSEKDLIAYMNDLPQLRHHYHPSGRDK